MKFNQVRSAALQDMNVPVRLKLAALWTSLMFCYIYGDYFGLFQPGNLESMLKGKMGPLGATTQLVLLETSVLMAIPSLMIFLSLVMKPSVNRWVNIALGLLYSFIMLASMPGAWEFYIFFGVVEIALSLGIVYCAWRWPRQAIVA